MKLNKLGKKISFIFIMLVISLTLFLVNKNINVKAEENQNSDSIINWVLTNNLPDGNYNVTVKGSTDGGKTEETITYPVELINYYDDVTYNSTDGENGVVELGDDTAEYKMLIVKYHKNLTINEGVTLTANTHTTTIDSKNYELTYKKGMYIHVSGTLTNNGTISMTARGTYNQEGENVYLWKNADGTFEYVPAIGGLGAASIQAPSGGATIGGTGNSGINRQTGGGGSGSAWYDSSISGAGGNGTSYSGGSGGAGVSRTGSSYTGNAGSSIGGPGGAGRAVGNNDAGGGAGNPGGTGARYGTAGETGTGGLLILFSKIYNNSGSILSNGSLGGTGDAGRAGSSGGGSINIFYASKLNEGTIIANGGNYGNTNGGIGGNGSITYSNMKEILSNNNYLKSLESNYGTLSPMFDSNVNDYTLTLDKYTSTFTLTGILSDEKASVIGLGKYKIDYNETKNIDIVVTSESGQIRTYTIKVTREKFGENEHTSKLSKLEIDGYELSPEFHPLTNEYSLEVPTTEIGLNVITKTFDSEAKVTMIGNKYIKNIDELIITVSAPNVENTIYKIKYNKVQMNNEYSFDYTGGEQVFNVPIKGKYKLETWGAQGGNASDIYVGGYGSYSTGNLMLNKNEQLYINVGGSGKNVKNGVDSGGYNGGGSIQVVLTCDNSFGSGGGATHISSKSGLLSSLENAIEQIYIVSSGGGGAGYRYCSSSDWVYGSGGSGGGIKGSNPIINSLWNVNVPSGGTQIAAGNGGTVNGESGAVNGSFGQGGSYTRTGGYTGQSGGGSGFYGGGLGMFAPSAGGSGYIGNPQLKDKSMYCYNCEESNEEETKTISTTNVSEKPISEYAKQGNGYAKITPILTSSDNYLSSLESSYGTLNPSFDPTVEEYTLTLDKYTSTFTLIGTLSDEKSNVIGLDTYKIDYNETKNIDIVVTSESGQIRTYTITATREKFGENEHSSKLSKLEIEDYTNDLEPEFHPLTNEYNIEIAKNEIGLNINAETFDSEAKVTIIGNKYMTEDSGVITITVTEPHLETTIYKINYTKTKVKSVYDFEYTGDVQEFVTPIKGKYKLETWGAGSSLGGGYGGYSTGNILLNYKKKLYIVVGENSKNSKGGYNGGGNASEKGSTNEFATGGGGATHIALINRGLLKNYENYKEDILMVSAGGGGGTKGNNNGSSSGGSGGGYHGVNGTGRYCGYGATQTQGGIRANDSITNNFGGFGYGSDADPYGSSQSGYYAAGGGGGYYGGSGGTWSSTASYVGGGGGGSGYIGNPLLTEKSMYCYNCEESNEENTKTISTTNVSEEPISEYAKQGNGYAKITPIITSNDNYLKLLKSNYGELSPVFDPTVEEYVLTLDKYTSNFALTGTLSNEKSSVIGLDTYKIDNGETKNIDIVVTSESGDIRTYTITATREKFGENEHTSKLSKLEIEDYTNDLEPEFHSLTNEYNIEIAKNEIGLNINAETFDSEAKVVVTGNKYMINDSGVITITVTESHSEDTIYKINYTKITTKSEYNFNYTGSEQIFNIPINGKYKLETWGAQGGSYNEKYYGGYGGYSVGIIKLTKNEKLYVNVGGMGKYSSGISKGGYNGGGNSTPDTTYYTTSGGGATHIATKSGLLATLEKFKDNILIVSGAGGGAGNSSNDHGIGGAGGGYTGVSGTSTYNSSSAGTGAHQSYGGSGNESGSFGLGGNAATKTSSRGSGGGSGYYGGGSGKSNGAAGGGGSGYIGNPLLTDKSMYCNNCEESNDEDTKTVSTTNANEEPISEYAKKGNGYAKITPILLNKDNYLSSLESSYGTLNPSFDPTIEKYTLTLDKYTSTFTLTGTLSDEKASVIGLGKYKIDYNETKNIDIVVTSESGQIRTYTVTVTREKFGENEHTSKLSKLEIENYEENLSPEFNPLTNEYNIEMMANEIDLNITAEAFDSEAKVTITGNKYMTEDSGVIIITVTEPHSEDTIYNINYTKTKVESEYEFDYTGSEQTFTVPLTMKYKLETWGASGGGKNCGKGSYSKGIINLNKNENYYVNVGGSGQKNQGGYNGGGSGQERAGSVTNPGYGGGGATHIATKSGLLSTLKDKKESILIVSGAGGGTSENNHEGGNAGGYIGSSGKGECYLSTGGTQVLGGKSDLSGTEAGFGYGGNSLYGSTSSDTYGAGGGGAGYYGGGAGGFESGSSCASGGAGGSGYIGNPQLTDKSMYCYNCEESSDENTKTVSTTNASEEPISEYAKQGNGYAKITPFLSTLSKDNYLTNLLVSKEGKYYEIDFDPTKEEYKIKVNVEDTKIKIEARPSSDLSKVEGLGEKEVLAGTNTYEILVTSESGEIRTYKVVVERPASIVSTAKDIEITGLVPSICERGREYCALDSEYNEEKKTYTMTVPAGIRELEFTVIKNHEYQKVVGEGVVKLKGGENIVTIEVTSEDGTKTSVYNYEIERDMTGNNYISNLEMINPQIDIGFNYLITEYAFKVDNSVTSLDMNITLDDEEASYIVEGNENFELGNNVVKIKVEAKNKEVREYILNVYRLSNGNALLNKLELENNGEKIGINPEFKDVVTNYTTTVENQIESVIVTGETQASTTTVEGLGEKALKTGINEINVTTTAEDGTIETYKIIVVREKDKNNYLKSLSVNEGNIEFNKETLEYEIRVNPYVKSLTINKELESEKASVRVIGNKDFKIGENIVKIIVRSEYGEEREYKIKVIKEGSEINNLRSLSVNEGSLSPEFSSEILEYEVNVRNEVKSIKVIGEKEDSLSQVKGNGTYKLTSGENKITITVISETGKEKEYVVKVKREYNTDNSLKSLSVNEGNLSPEFNSETKEYIVNVGSTVSEITIEAVANAEESKVIGNGTYQINYGENKKEIKVEAEDGSERIYKVTIIRDKEKSANLKSLIVKEGILNPSFDKMIVNYEVKVENSVEKVNVIYEAEEEGASVEVTGNENLKIGENEVNVIVTSLSGIIKTYKITVIRQEKTEKNLNLRTLDVTSCAIEYNKNVTYYECEVENEVDKVEVNAEAEDENMLVEGLGEKTLQTGKNVIGIKVKDKEEGKEKDYQVVINRLKSKESRLSNIEIENHELNKIFNKEDYEYEVTTKENSLNVKVSKIKEEEKVEIKGNEGFILGENIIEIKVISEDGNYESIYKIKVIKEKSDNTNLKSLEVEGHKEEIKFNKGILEYTLGVENEENSVVIKGETEDKNASIKGLGMHSLKTGENVIEIEVTSEDEVNTKIYKVIVNRKGSKNNYLKSLSVKEGNIEFSREKKEYEIEVEYEIDKVNVEAVAEEENASIIGQGEREIKIGENNVNVIVTAEDGSVREYIIKVKRKNPVTSKLLNIEVKNYELDSVFDSNKTEYEVEVDNEIESIEINVSKLDPGSTYVVEGNENFKVGLNEVRIISTSSDGKESTTYVIRVNRQSYSNTYLSSLSVEGYTLSPVFDKKELSYEVIVEKEIEKVRVDASAENIESKVEGLGETILNEKETEIKVRVISKSGVKRIYKIKVIKKLGNNANIKNISTQKGKIEVVNETSYKMTVGKTELKVRKEDLVIELEDKNASIEMEEEILLEETRIYKIKVISEDKSTEKEYVINVEKEKSSDGRLKSLSTNYGEISPEFNKDVKEYIVNIEEEKEEIELTIEKNEEDAEIVTKERVFGIKEYETEINIIVQAENGEIETYKIKVIKSITRKLGLKNIEITKVKEKCESCILPKYEENTETYEMSVPSTVKEIGIEYEKNHPNQKVKIYKGIEEIKEPYTLETGENIYKIEVENSYGEKREYIYRIEKLRGDNNYLKSLKVISPEKEIEGFNKEKQEYEIEVENNYENIKVEAEAEDEEASIEIKGTTYLIEGNNDVRIIVSAGNKEKREYILHVLRKPESNNLLKTLTVSSGSIYELSPKFREGINNYYLKVGSIVDKVSVEGIAEDENAVVEGNGEKELKIGLNEIEIKVISKEKVERIYKIKIERESSKNIYLKKLEILNGEINPEFNKEKQEYEVNVKNTENELKMEVEAEDPNAKVEIIGNENLTYGENIVKIKVISSDLSVSRTYLLKVTKEGEGNNNLKGIKINEEEIEGFDKEKIEYEKEVENNVEKVKIEGIKESENASVIGNGIYSLEEGENKIIIKVVAQNKEEKEYIIKIKRKYNNYLKEIVTDKGEVIPEFKKETLEYTLEVENKEENITVIGIKEDKDAVVEGNGKYELKVGENKIIIKVKNKEQEERDYIIKVIRKGSDNNNLKYLTVIESEFEKEFDKNELEYTVYVRDTLDKITIKEEAEDPDAKVEIIGNENFSETEEEVKVRVTSTSGKIKEYKIKVIREEESKFSNYLSELSVSEGVLSPKFNKEESEYAVTVGKDIKRIKVNGIRESIESTVEGLGEKELEIGRNEIRVVVRSKDGKKRTYTIIVYRKEESDGRISEIGIENGELSPVFNKNKYSYKLRIESDEKIIKINRVKTVEKEGTYKIEGDLTKVETGNVIKIIGESADKKDKKEYVIEVEREKSRNANLKEIKVSEGILSPEFNKEIKEYTLKIGENVERVKIEGIKESEKASVQGNGVYEGKNQIVNIVVVSENGEVNVYRVKIEKEKNRNNYLKSLKVKGKEISPEFNKEINEYEVVVSEEEDIVIVEAEKENNLSEVIYNKEVKIKEEETKEKIEVISESGDIRIYTLTIKKEKKISSKIKSLEVKEGVISPEFNKEILEYNVRIPNEKEKITLEIELEDKEGTYKVIGNENLKVGENVIEIEVTSSDGKEKRVYKINVEREELSNNYLKSLKVKGYEIEFNKEELNYEIEIEKEIEEIEVEAEAEVKTSTVIGTGKYEIKEKEKEIIIKVESENKVERNYKIKIRKRKSDNNYLSNIIVSEGNIEFSREKIEYEIKVNEGTEEIEIEGIKEEEDASVIGNGRYKIEVGEKEIKLIVTSENGSIREYKIKVIREASSNTNIVRMTPSEGTLTPAFNNEETEYEIMVGKEVNVMDIEVELESKDASVQGNKNIIIEGRRKEVNIIVAAEDGSTRIVRVIIKKESGVEEIRVEKEEIMIGLGEEKEIKVTVLPEEAENKNVRYETEEEIVRIEGNKIIGEKIGRTIVKIISEENEEIKKEIIVNVILKEIKTEEYEVRKVEEGKILIGMEEGTTLGEIKEKLLNEESTIKIYNEENKELEESEIVKTGERIKVEIEGEICDEAIIILRGDINCDGEVNVTDKTIIKNHILSKEEIIDYRKYAADVVEDNEINVSDNTKLGNYLLGKITTLN